MIPRALIFDKLAPWLLLLGNLLVVFGSELAHDEAYYWLFSQNLDWGYFDHPPMTAWLIALTSWLGGEVGVRLAFVLVMQLSAWLFVSSLPHEEKRFGWLGLNIFPLLAFAGALAIPDGPLVFFSALWLWHLRRALADDNVANAIISGVLTAMLLYSKYHGVLFIVGTIIALPRLLLRPTFWVSAGVALVLFLPHVYWQWSHGFATFRYHFVDRPGVALGWRQPLEFFVLQLILPGLFLAPLAWKHLLKTKATSDELRVFKVITLFVVLFFFVSTFTKRLEANWTVAAGLPFILFLAGTSFYQQHKQWVDRLGMLSLGLVVAARLMIVAPADWYGVKRLSEVHGWKSWAHSIAQQTPGCSLAANTYQVASKLSFYLQRQVPALNVKSRLNQFEFWDWEKTWDPDREVCWITSGKYPGAIDVTGPDGKKLVLVKGKKLSDILSLKTREL